MKVISFEPKDSLPGIIFENETGKFQIYGESFPEDAYEFFNPIFNWMDEYIENPHETTILDFQLSYFNTVSAKNFLHIMTQMEKLTSTGHNAKIRWFYNNGDEDMIEAGEEFESIVNVDFEMIQINNNIEEESEEYFDELMDEIM